MMVKHHFLKHEPTLLPLPPNTKQTKTNPGSAGFAPGWTFLFRKRSPCLCELAAPALMGRVLPLDRPVPGLVWFLSVPGTWEKSKDQEIFGAEQSLESPALAPSFRGAEGLVTPPSPPVATGDARVSVQPQGAHAPTYLRRGRGGRRLLILLPPEEQNTGQSEEYVFRQRRIQNRFSHQLGGESPSHLLHMRPRSPGLCSWRLSATPGAKLQDENVARRGKRGCEISRSGCECQGKGGEMTVTVCDAVNGIDWKTKVSTEGSKKAP